MTKQTESAPLPRAKSKPPRGPQPHEPGTAEGEVQALRDRVAQLEARLVLAQAPQGAAEESVLAQEAYYRTDAQGRITFGTRAAAGLLGIPYDRYLGERLADYYAEPDGRARFLAALAEGGGRVENYEAPMRHTNGAVVWVLTTARMLRAPDGTLAGVEGVARNVTRLKETEGRLRRGQGLLQQVMDTVPHWLFVKDRDARYVMVNRAMADFYGREPADFVGRRYADVAHRQGEEVTGTDTVDEAVIRTGRAVEQPSMTVQTRSGQRAVRHIIKLPWRDEQGTIIGVMGISQDVTEQRRIQDTLSESRQLLQTVFDTLPVWVSVKGPDLRYMMVNRCFVEDSGLTVQDYIGHTAAEVPFRSAEETAPVDAADREVLRTGERVVLAEHALTLRDGQRLLQHFKAPYRNAQGEVQGVVTTSMDLTERLRMEARLRESEERLSGILSMAPDAIIAVDEAQNIVLFNRGAEETFGYAGAEVLGQPLEMLIPARYHGTHRHQVEQFTGRGTGRRYMSERGRIYGRRKDGSEFPAEASISSYATKQGRVHTVILRDISSRVLAEDTVHRSEARLKQAMLIGGLGTFEWDVVSGQVELSPEAADIFGMAHAEGEPLQTPRGAFLRFCHPDDLPTVREATAQALAGQAEFALEYRITRDGGSQRWIKSLAEILWSADHEPQRVVGILQDVTESRELEERLRHSQKIEAVGNLAGGVAHDFNNMLQIIRGYVELGLQQAQAPRLRGHLEQVLAAADSAAQLTRQLLAFSRREVLRMRPVDLNLLVTQHADMLRRVIQEDIELTVAPHPAPLTVVADSGMLQQVVINLCVNARDAMPHGGTIRIALGHLVADEAFLRANTWARHPAYATLSVTDDGPGMAPHIRDRVFEPYFTTKESAKGTGLGLSMAYGILRQHDGNIEVRSAPGEGATFTLYLPEAAQEVRDGVPTRTAAPAAGCGRILVAEDEPGVRQLAVSMLEAGGYEVLQAADGVEALERVRAGEAPPDLVVLDMVMPRLGGRQTYEALRAEGFRMPVVFATGYEGSAGNYEFVRSERVPVLRKPYAADDLLGLVARLLTDADA